MRRLRPAGTGEALAARAFLLSRLLPGARGAPARLPCACKVGRASPPAFKSGAGRRPRARPPDSHARPNGAALLVLALATVSAARRNRGAWCIHLAALRSTLRDYWRANQCHTRTTATRVGSRREATPPHGGCCGMHRPGNASTRPPTASG